MRTRPSDMWYGTERAVNIEEGRPHSISSLPIPLCFSLFSSRSLRLYVILYCCSASHVWNVIVHVILTLSLTQMDLEFYGESVGAPFRYDHALAVLIAETEGTTDLKRDIVLYGTNE